MNIITAYAVKNDCYKKAQPMTPKGIVVHSTGANNPNLKRYVDAPSEVGINLYGNHWNKKGLQVCVHAFIGYDKNKKVTTANILPYNYACWGVGRGAKGSYNYNPTGHIQFEICEDGLDNEVYFKEAYTEAVEYCALLCKKFSLKPDTIVSHREAHDLGYGSNHGDPHNWFTKFGKTMSDFRAAVKKELIPTVTAQPLKAITFKPYIVRVTTSALNIREGAGTSYKITGCIKNKGSYTIVSESAGWGKLKSGAGWISLQYAKKI